jgi:alkylation response protein AidB-like acyl-CoA dehydrogenase
MDFQLPPDDDPRRLAVREWLREHPEPSGTVLAEAGYVAPHWPQPWGRGSDPIEQLIIDDELGRAKVRRPINPIGIGWAGPTLLVAGTPEQHDRYLPGLLDGSEMWCQLFSEPGSGSDLASLTTRAVRDGDEYVVTGQKIWTTLAHVSRYGILLARTDPGAEPHKGISYFVIDMASEGVSTKPIRQMDGEAMFNEVFLDDVRIPAANLVGDEHDGWRLAKVTLGNERVSLSGEGALWGLGPTADDLLDLVRAEGGVADAMLRQKLASLYIEQEVLRLIRLRTVSARVRGLEPGPEVSVRKALADEHGQHVMALAVELAGTDGLVLDRGPFGSDDATWAKGYLYSRALTVGGGTSEVQRNIIGERVLGLPRDA